MGLHTHQNTFSTLPTPSTLTTTHARQYTPPHSPHPTLYTSVTHATPDLPHILQIAPNPTLPTPPPTSQSSFLPYTGTVTPALGQSPVCSIVSCYTFGLFIDNIFI